LLFIYLRSRNISSVSAKKCSLYMVNCTRSMPFVASRIVCECKENKVRTIFWKKMIDSLIQKTLSAVAACVLIAHLSRDPAPWKITSPNRIFMRLPSLRVSIRGACNAKIQYIKDDITFLSAVIAPHHPRQVRIWNVCFHNIIAKKEYIWNILSKYIRNIFYAYTFHNT